MKSNSGRDDAAHEVYWGQMERLFHGKLKLKDAGNLRQHIRDCGTCENAYEKWVAAERAMYPKLDDDACASIQLERVAQRIFAEEPAKVTEPNRARFYGVWGLVASCLLAFILVRPMLSEDQFQTRSGGLDISGKVTLRALRVREDATGKSEVLDLGSSDAGLSNGDKVLVLYSNLEDFRYLMVSYRNAAGVEHVLIPVTRITSGKEDHRIGEMAEVNGDWMEGPLVFTGWFARERLGTQVADFESVTKSGDESSVVKRIVRSRVSHRKGTEP